PLFVYPNPADEQLNVEWAGTGEVLFVLFSTDGQMIDMIAIEEKEVGQISTKDLSPGPYYYKVSADSGFVKSGRIVIVR
ncbi:MAG: T9SS type A sorting domain-containing protein, partial [Saprospiraceae bacterium]|nr:T9SS type A sorting domain-containing protein [Saprospiraceae bacterium]